MNSPVNPETQGTSTRPYMIRALHDWCTDNGFTPYLAVQVDHTVEVPREYVRNHEIVLNVSFDATSQLVLGNEWIEFQARFGGRARILRVPVDHVIAIYARENGQGMAFPAPTVLSPTDEQGAESSPGIGDDREIGDNGGGPGAGGAARGESGPRLVESAPPEGASPAQTREGSTEPGASPVPPTGRPSLKRVK